MGDWKSASWDDDGWEDVASAPSHQSKAVHTVVSKTAKVEPANTPAKDGKQPQSTEGDDPGTRASSAKVSSAAVANGNAPSKADVAPEPDAARDSAPSAALAAAERKIAALTRERDGLRRARDARASTVEQSREKDKQIAAVLAEGEQLSKRIAEKETALRTVKTSLRERDEYAESLRARLTDAEAKIEALSAKQRTLETSEKSAREGIEAAERRLRQMDNDLRTKSTSSAALDAARSQLESLRKSHATALENQSMRLQAEFDTKLSKVKDDAERELGVSNTAIAELREHLTQVTENAGWKEDQLRKELSELRARAQSLEARNEELAEAVPGATRPLLRQVEALQAAATERMRAASAAERAQLERLRAAEAAVAAGTERERAAETRIGSLMARVAALEEQAKLATAETARVSSELRDAQSRAAEAELSHQKALEDAQATAIKTQREKERGADELSRARAAHLDDAEAAEERERTLRQKIANLESRIEASESKYSKAVAASASLFGSPGQDGPMRMSESSSSVALSPVVGAEHDHAFSPTPSPGGVGSTTIRGSASSDGGFASPFTDSSAVMGGVYDTERLQSALRQKSDEITSLQAQLGGKEHATQALANEIVELTARVEELTAELSDAPQMRKELDELKTRHTALLELHGERDERIQELEADIVDINQMYKEQITELLMKLERVAV